MTNPPLPDSQLTSFQPFIRFVFVLLNELLDLELNGFTLVMCSVKCCVLMSLLLLCQVAAFSYDRFVREITAEQNTFWW